jgi:hypothetical protein
MSPHDLVSPLLQQHHRAAQDLIVAAGDNLHHLLPVAQQGISAKQRGKAGPPHCTYKGHGPGMPGFEGSRDRLQVEQIDGSLGALAQIRRGKAPERQDAIVLPRPLEVLHELDGELPGAGENGNRAVSVHQGEPTGSRGVQIARSLPSRMKSRIS